MTRTEFLEHAEQALNPPPFSRERLLHLFTSAPNAFWRHDIDLSLDAAVRMARFAQIAGVQSTFYVMARSPFYNPFSPDGEHALGEILDCGHRLGLHCDYRRGEVPGQVERERLLLDSFYPDMFTHQVSFHMPPPEVLWKDYSPFFTNAYSPEWEGRYVSDSRGVPVGEVSNDMQVCLHPEHWHL